jgi:hypothetical protein
VQENFLRSRSKSWHADEEGEEVYWGWIFFYLGGGFLVISNYGFEVAYFAVFNLIFIMLFQV